MATTRKRHCPKHDDPKWTFFQKTATHIDTFGDRKMGEQTGTGDPGVDGAEANQQEGTPLLIRNLCETLAT